MPRNGIAGLHGLKTADCVENMEYFQPIYVYNPGEKNQKLEEPGMKSQDSTVSPGVKSQEATQIPRMKIPEPFSVPAPAPAPGPGPGPGPKTHHFASSGKMLLPTFGTFILVSASTINPFTAL